MPVISYLQPPKSMFLLIESILKLVLGWNLKYHRSFYLKSREKMVADTLY